MGDCVAVIKKTSNAFESKKAEKAIGIPPPHSAKLRCSCTMRSGSRVLHLRTFPLISNLPPTFLHPLSSKTPSFHTRALDSTKICPAPFGFLLPIIQLLHHPCSPYISDSEERNRKKGVRKGRTFSPNSSQPQHHSKGGGTLYPPSRHSSSRTSQTVYSFLSFSIMQPSNLPFIFYMPRIEKFRKKQENILFHIFQFSKQRKQDETCPTPSSANLCNA